MLISAAVRIGIVTFSGLGGRQPTSGAAPSQRRHSPSRMR